MDHNDNLKFNFPTGLASEQYSDVNFPFNGFPQFQFDSPAEIGGAKSDQLSDPKPLECLLGNPIPPFLSKSYDLVEDPSLDPIISWGEKGNTFVVWEPADFATIVLPRYFKHRNFSSFVRQLNTYGFRKIDTNKWEFANEFFLQGSKHLLKNIKRRRSTHSEASGPEVEMKLEKLRTEGSVIMQEVADLQQQNRETEEHMETVKKRLQISERKQEKMVSFIAKAVQNPEFIARVMEMKEQRLLDCSSPPRTRRKIVKQETEEPAGSSEVMNSLPRNYAVQERMPFSSENESSDELGAPQDFGYFVDFPEELATDKKEEILSMSNSMVDSWSTVGGYNFPVNEAFFSGGHLDTWELSDMQGVGISEIGKWQYGDSEVGGYGSNDL